MFTKLTDTNKAAIFSVLVLFMATGVAMLIRILDLTGGMGMWATPGRAGRCLASTVWG
jgi:hypothetical protein